MQVTREGLKPGDVIDGKYILRDCLGAGGMGSVFRAEQPSTGSAVAIKIAHPRFLTGSVYANQMRTEAVTASCVESPHCVKVIDYSCTPDGIPYLVMSYVEGRSLGRWLAEEAIPLARAVGLFEQVLLAIAATHRSGIVHGDIKSDNFLVESIGDRDHVTMIDFGLARAAGTRTKLETEDGALLVIGTPEYMAPELAFGEPPTMSSDLYAAGVILYELLTGTTPFGGGSSAQIMLRQTKDRVIPPSLRKPDRDIPRALDRVVLRALAKRPTARFPDVETLGRGLRAALAASSRVPRTSRLLTAGSTPVAPSRDSDRPERPRRFARGSDCAAMVSTPALVEMHRVVGNALRGDDLAEISNSYLRLADLLCRQRQFSFASRELQEGIAILTARHGSSDLDAIDQLVLALAALYDRGGNHHRARLLAATADRSPTVALASRASY